MKDIKELIEVMKVVVPHVKRLASNVFNPYTPSNLTSDRVPGQRKYFAEKIASSETIKTCHGMLVRCMMTKEFGNGSKVVAAHLIPCKTEGHILNQLHLKADDVNSRGTCCF